MASGKFAFNDQNAANLPTFTFFLIKIAFFLSKKLAVIKNTLFLSGKSITTNNKLI